MAPTDQPYRNEKAAVVIRAIQEVLIKHNCIITRDEQGMVLSEPVGLVGHQARALAIIERVDHRAALVREFDWTRHGKLGELKRKAIRG